MTEPTLSVREFSIGCTHTISTGVPYENIKVEGRLTCSVAFGTSDEDFREILKAAEVKLKEIIVETYNVQKRPKKPNSQE